MNAAEPPAHAPGFSSTYAVPAAIVARIGAYAEQRGSSPHAVLAAAFALALGRFTGADEVTLAVARGTDDAIGVRGTTAPHERFATLLDDVDAAFARRAAPPLGRDGVPETRLHVADDATSLAFVVAGDGRSLPASLVASFTAAVAHVTATVAAAAHEPIGEVALQADDRGDAFPRALADPDASYAAAEPVAMRFRAHAERDPGTTAILDGTQRFAYGELAVTADRIRRVLLARDVRPGDVVGIVAERSALAIAAMLAAWDAGAAFVALEPDVPERRRRENADDAGVRILLDEEALRVAAADAGREDAPPLPPPHVPRPDEAAYVLYTSGSTGRAKGVVVEHGNLARLFTASERRFAYRNNDVWSLCFPFAFDASIWNVWAALAYGASLVILASDRARDPFAMRRAFAENGVTVVAMTPSAFAAFDAAAEAPYRDAPIRAVLLGGEATTPAFVARFHERYGSDGTALWNLYGPTETTVFATMAHVSAEERFARFTTIGTPLDDVACAVLDPRGRPVPTGFVGELVVRGAAVARGYRGTAASTAFRRVGPDVADRSYATGDLARTRADGSFEYLRRNDAQINLRGFRIEPGEIEAALLRHPGIADAAATFAPSDDGGTLTAHVVPTTPSATLDDVATWLADRLPPAMLPTRVRVIPAMPLTASGKRDLRALAAAASLPQSATTSASRADTPLERYLCTIAADILGFAGIDAGVDFFALGGHSLLAVRFAGRAARNAPADGSLPISANDMSVVLRALYEQRTMRALAHVLERRGNASSPIVRIREGAPDATPLFWFHGMYGISREGSYFGDFVAALPPEMPVYAIEPHGYDGAAFASDFTLLAHERFEQIRRIRPRGAVRLGGFSNGAMVALETARLFRGAGEHVDSLTLVSPGALMRLARLRMRAYEAYARLRGIADDVSWGLAIGKVHRRAGVVRFALEHIARGDAAPAIALARKTQRLLFRRGPVVEEDEGAFAALEPRLEVAIARYRPRPYAGNVTVIVGNADDPWRWTRHRWKRMIPQMIEHVVPGDHHFVVEHAKVVAAIVAAP